MTAMKHIEILGFKVKDKVTGIKGVATTVSFDLYGCIQVVISREVDKDGKTLDSRWFDINRLEVSGKTRVMEPPNFDFGPVSEGKKGAAEKPSGYKA